MTFGSSELNSSQKVGPRRLFDGETTHRDRARQVCNARSRSLTVAAAGRREGVHMSDSLTPLLETDRPAVVADLVEVIEGGVCAAVRKPSSGAPAFVPARAA